MESKNEYGIVNPERNTADKERIVFENSCIRIFYRKLIKRRTTKILKIRLQGNKNTEKVARGSTHRKVN